MKIFQSQILFEYAHPQITCLAFLAENFKQLVEIFMITLKVKE